MIEPNRLTNPSELAVRARIEVLFERIDAFGAAIVLLPAPRLDLESRDAGLVELVDLADRHGRATLLEEARRRVRDDLQVRMATRNQAVVIGQPLLSSGTVEDQVARMAAIEDAVAVAVVEDLLDPETAMALSSPGRRMLGLAPPDPLESPAGTAAADEDHPDRDTGVASPGDAADEEAEAAEAEAQDALRQRRAVLFVAIGAIVLPIAFATGLDLPALVLIGLSIALIAWLFA